MKTKPKSRAKKAALLNPDKALEIILKHCTRLSSEKVSVGESLHRVLDRTIVAGENVPSFDNSAMDGFALRSKDTQGATTRKAVVITVVGESSAGNVYSGTLHKGEAVRVMTGGKIPKGADAVVPIEDVVESEETISIKARVKTGAHIRRAGDDVRKGQTVFAAGTLLTPARVGVLASLGITKLRVVRRPRVSILSTGDELVSVGKKIQDGQIRNSTAYALAGYAKEAGAHVRAAGIVKDKRRKIRKAISAALRSDVLLVTGGVSVGKYDHVKEAMTKAGVRIRFWKANIKPGKPIVFGTKGKTLVFGLPGNPSSSGVTFLQFVKPALYALQGSLPSGPIRLMARLDEPITKRDGRRHFVRGICWSNGRRLLVRTTGSQSSGILSSMANANCLIILPEKSRRLKKGADVQIEML